MNKIKLYLIGAFITFIILLIGNDVTDFYQALYTPYETPWYDNRIWYAPYTNLRIALAHSQTHWTINGDKSEIWLIKETLIHGKTFWCIIERIPITTIKRVE